MYTTFRIGKSISHDSIRMAEEQCSFGFQYEGNNCLILLTVTCDKIINGFFLWV